MSLYCVTRESIATNEKVTIKENAIESYFEKLIIRVKETNRLKNCNALRTMFSTEKFIYRYEYLPNFDFFDK